MTTFYNFGLADLTERTSESLASIEEMTRKERMRCISERLSLLSAEMSRLESLLAKRRKNDVPKSEQRLPYDDSSKMMERVSWKYSPKLAQRVHFNKPKRQMKLEKGFFQPRQTRQTYRQFVRKQRNRR
eukprot:TRINITY_DN3267_c0_g1_i1.p2 TRINITY_DN3267_c0_g1~~TRINITY_DN3267_c0_g1_i1.p2  ORF type:complete len:129 (-),score=26.17 TRINITY_DN3267_c0_g1_i1:75-461(-)